MKHNVILSAVIDITCALIIILALFNSATETNQGLTINALCYVTAFGIASAIAGFGIPGISVTYMSKLMAKA